jgi:hypothetical protein
MQVRAKIAMMMGPAEVHEFKEGSGRITVQKCSGTVDGVSPRAGQGAGHA